MSKVITKVLLIGAVIMGILKLIAWFKSNPLQMCVEEAEAQGGAESTNSQRPSLWYEELRKWWRRLAGKLGKWWTKHYKWWAKHYKQFMVFCGACLLIFGYLRYNPGSLIYPYSLFPRTWDFLGLLLLLIYGAPFLVARYGKESGAQSSISSIIGLVVLLVIGVTEAFLAVMISFIVQIFVGGGTSGTS